MKITGNGLAASCQLFTIKSTDIFAVYVPYIVKFVLDLYHG